MEQIHRDCRRLKLMMLFGFKSVNERLNKNCQELLKVAKYIIEILNQDHKYYQDGNNNK